MTMGSTRGRRLALVALLVAWLLPACSKQDDAAPAAAAAPQVAAAAAAVRPEGAGDWYTPDLEARATKLAADVAAAPTTAATLKARAMDLWRWANAAAIAGAALDPNLPATVARIAALPDPVPASTPGLAELCRAVDDAVRERALLGATPGAIGRLTSPNTGPFPVDSKQTLDLVYTVGDTAIEPGGGFVVAVRAVDDVLAFQAQDPAGEGYTTVTASNPEVRIAVDRWPVGGVFGDANGAAVARPFFRVTEGKLRPGDTVSIRVGETAKGGPGLHLPSASGGAVRFRVWVRPNAKSGVYALNEIPFLLEGLGAVQVRGFAPSVVAVGENARITVRSEDGFHNRASGGFQPYVVTANGEQIGRVANTNVAVNTLNTSFGTPGVYYIGIESADGKLRGEANPILVEANPTRRVLWGDTNGHTRAGVGQGNADDWFIFARDDARLDFAALTDDDQWLDDAEWEAQRRAVLKERRPNEFETYLGNTWTAGPGADGDRVVLYRAPERRRRADRQRLPQVPQLFAALAAENAARDVLSLPVAHRAGPVARLDPRFEHLVQIASTRGTFDAVAQRYQLAGAQVGVIGASADAMGHPALRVASAGTPGNDAPGGLAAVLAPKRTRDAIFDALAGGHAYATNGARIILDVALNGAPMGTRAPAAPRRVLSGQVIGTAPIERIVVARNGQDVQVQDFARVASPAAAHAIEVRFASGAEAAANGALPRGFRVWRGSLRVDGAKLKEVRSPGNDNWYTERVAQNGSDAQRVDFVLRTRGNARAIVLVLEGNVAAARVTLDVASQVPDGSVQAQAAAPIADALRQTIGAGAIGGGELVLRRPAGAAVDSVTLRLLNPPTERLRFLNFTDTAGRDGDAYTVRVYTADGGVAWSSPVWVGGRAGQPLAVAPAVAP